MPQLIDDDLCTEAGKKLLGETGSETDFDYKSAYEKSLFELLFKQLKTLEDSAYLFDQFIKLMQNA